MRGTKKKVQKHEQAEKCCFDYTIDDVVTERSGEHLPGAFDQLVACGLPEGDPAITDAVPDESGPASGGYIPLRDAAAEETAEEGHNSYGDMLSMVYGL